jgi:4-amino-4-deoxychorismate lyase
MYPLLETIKTENGALQNLKFHQKRFDRSRLEFLGLKDPLHLNSVIKIPDVAKHGIFKCRVTYGKTIGKFEFVAYRPKPVKSLEVVMDNQIEYNYKFTDRTHLKKLLLQKGECDDILIVKNGLITDTSYSNIVFYDGTCWVTPDRPLLRGTMRESLLESGKIKSERIKIDDLQRFSKFALINAMLDFDGEGGISVDNIRMPGIITHYG